uniref:Uncharacterized protein n=1 Tax=Anguilla anguilla TaxID=7936 RepID=A0A0E9TVU9_ANGAN
MLQLTELHSSFTTPASTCCLDLLVGTGGFLYFSRIVGDMYCDPYLMGYCTLVHAQTYLERIHSAPNNYQIYCSFINISLI